MITKRLYIQPLTEIIMYDKDFNFCNNISKIIDRESGDTGGVHDGIDGDEADANLWSWDTDFLD